MSDRQLSYHGHEDEEYDKECDVPYTKQPSEENSKNTSVQLASLNADVIKTGPLRMIDTYDRPGDTFAESNHARTGSYLAAFENNPGKRIPKIGSYAEAGVRRARPELSILEAEVKGPSSSNTVEISVAGVVAMTRAELVSASGRAGPVGVKVGLGVDTGVSAGVRGVEAKFLGTGFSFGEKNSVSVLGSEVSCVVM